MECIQMLGQLAAELNPTEDRPEIAANGPWEQGG